MATIVTPAQYYYAGVAVRQAAALLLTLQNAGVPQTAPQYAAVAAVLQQQQTYLAGITQGAAATGKHAASKAARLAALLQAVKPNKQG